MKEIYKKYASLLINYCLAVKPNDKVYINTSYLAEPLLLEVIKQTYIAGGIPVWNIELNGTNELLLEYGNEAQLAFVHPLKQHVFENFDFRLFDALFCSNTCLFLGTSPRLCTRCSLFGCNWF